MTNNIGALALFALECKAAEIRKANPDLSAAQAFSRAYTDPANREAAKAERRGNRPGGSHQPSASIRRSPSPSGTVPWTACSPRPRRFARPTRRSLRRRRLRKSTGTTARSRHRNGARRARQSMRNCRVFSGQRQGASRWCPITSAARALLAGAARVAAAGVASRRPPVQARIE